jgi:hypothetical protein
VREYAIDRGCGQCGDVGKRGQESLVVRDHRGDLRLLQHDLRKPDSIGIARALPWQIVAAVLALPRDEPGRERSTRKRRRHRLGGHGVESQADAGYRRTRRLASRPAPLFLADREALPRLGGGLGLGMFRDQLFQRAA